MRDHSDNGSTARAIVAGVASARTPSESVALTLSRLINEVEDGRTTARVALTTMMLKGIRAGRDLEIDAQHDAAKNSHVRAVEAVKGPGQRR